MIAPKLHTARDGTQSWQVAWRHNGRRTAATFSAAKHPRKGEAEKLAKRAAQLVEARERRISRDDVYREIIGITDEPAADPFTLNEWFTLWADKKTGVEPGTLAKYRGQWARHMAASIGVAPLESLTPDHVDTWVLELTRKPVARGGKNLSAKTVHRQHALMHLVLKGAVRAGRAKSNAAIGTPLPRIHSEQTSEERVFLTKAEAGLVLAAITSPKVTDMTRVLLGTGLRWSELTALQPRDIDHTRTPATLSVQRAWKKQGNGNGYKLGAPKSERSRRTISISPETLAVLEKYIDWSKPMALIFANRLGRRFDHSNFMRDHWYPAIRLARGLGVDKAGRPLAPAAGRVLGKAPTPHSMRHTHAAWLLSDGIPLSRVSRRLGHESEATTDRFYGHLVPGNDLDLLDVLKLAR